MKYGCARVSTDDQNPALQLAALLRCLKKLEHGDTLIGGKPGMEARPAGPQLARFDNHARRPEKARREFRSLTEAIDTETPMFDNGTLPRCAKVTALF